MRAKPGYISVQAHYKEDDQKIFRETEQREKHHRSHHFYFKNYRLTVDKMGKINIYYIILNILYTYIFTEEFI